MPIRTSYEEGTPSWVDLATTDPAAAQEFYGKLFGWEFEANPTDQGSEYIMARQGGKAAAGMMQQAPEQAAMGIPSMWNSYITTNDLEATLAKVEAAGGSIMMGAMDVMGSGRMAVIVDPGGAVACLWQALDSIGAEVVNEHGAFCWSECQTTEVAATAGFYSELFGWQAQETDMGDLGSYTVFNLPGSKSVGEGIAGAMNPPAPGIPAHWSIIFAVDDCDQRASLATAAGGSVRLAPFDMPIGRLAVIADPQGAAFQILQMNEPAA